MTKEIKFKRYNITKTFLIFWSLCIGFGVILISLCLFIEPDGSILGVSDFLIYLRRLPFNEHLFNDFIFPTILLLIVIGIPHIIGFFSLLVNNKNGIDIGYTNGVLLIIWMSLEFILFPTTPIMIMLLCLAILELFAGIIANLFYLQTLFDFSLENSPKTLNLSHCAVIYYSRMGYAEKLAYELSLPEHSELIKLEIKEKVANTKGFFICLINGLFKKELYPYNDINLSNYDKIVIVSPIWTSYMASPIRGFMKQNSEYLKKIDVEIVFVHYSKHLSKRAVLEAKKYANITKVLSYKSRYGKLKEL